MSASNRASRLLVVVLSIALLAAACGGGDGDTTTTTEAEATDTTSDGGGETTTTAGETTTTAGESEPPAADSKVTYAWSIPLASLDPHATPSNFDPIYIGLAYDTLLVREADGTFSPMLATSWEFGDGYLDLELREGVAFHGGREFDAEAVRLNFERVTTLEGSNRGGPLAAAIESVEVLDPLTVRMNLNPDGAGVVLGALSSMGGMMINPDSFEEDLAVSADGTGPYRVTSVDPGVNVEYERYEGTWAPEDARVQQVEIVTNVDSAQRLNLLLTDEVQATNIDTFQIETVEEAGYTTHFRVGDDAFVMQFNWERLSDQRQRQAIEMTLDRDALLQGIHAGVSEAGGQIQTMSDPAYNTDVSPDPDVDAAIGLAQESGLEGQTIQLLTAGVPNLQAYAEAIQPMIEQLGVSVEITLVEFGQLFSEWAAGNHDISIIYFTGNPDLALSYENLLGADSAINAAGTPPGNLESLLTESFSETDPEARTEIFKELAAEADEQGAVAPLIHPVQPIVTAPGIQIDEDRLRLFGGFNLRGIGPVE